MMKFILAVVCVLGATFKCETAVSEPTTVKNAAGPETGQNTTGDTLLGRGFYCITFRNCTVAPRVCYNAQVALRDAPDNRILYSADDLYNIRKHVPTPLTPETERYLRSIADRKRSIPLNYFFQLYKRRSHVEILGYEDSILNKDGRKAYSGEKSQFRLLCGDNYISFYDDGALLISTLTIKLDSVDSRRKLEEEVEHRVSLENVEAVIKSAVQKSKINGSVTTQALQIGGEPSRLSKILNRHSDGYYALTCNLTAIDDCIKATTRFLDYAKNDFPKQVSFYPDSKGILPLTYSPGDLSSFGFEPPASPNA